MSLSMSVRIIMLVGVFCVALASASSEPNISATDFEEVFVRRSKARPVDMVELAVVNGETECFVRRQQHPSAREQETDFEEEVFVRRSKARPVDMLELAVVDGEEDCFVRRQQHPAVRVQETRSGEPEPWEQFVRHENQAKAKEQFENDLADDLAHEVIIAIIGFTCTLGLQRTFRLKNGRFEFRNPRSKVCKASARRVLHSKVDISKPPSAPSSPSSEADDIVETHETCSKTRTDADALKKIAKIVSAGKADDVQSFLLTSVNSIDLSNLPSADAARTTDAIMTLLRSCVAAKHFAEAIIAFDCMEKRLGRGNRQLWSLLLYIAVEAGASNRCDEFYAKLCAVAGDSGPSGRDLVNIVRKHARHDNLEGLQAVLDGLNNLASREQFDRLTRNRALAACYREGATRLVDCIASHPVFIAPFDIVAYNTLITCYSRAGQYHKCFATFTDMEVKGVAPTQATFGSLFEASVGAEDWECAIDLFNKIPTYGISINAQHCTILIRGLVKQNRLKDAEQLLENMLRVDVQLDVVTFYTLLRAYADLGDNDATQRVFDRMVHQGVQPDEYICNAMLHSCTITRASADYINSILDGLISAGVTPSTTTLSLALKALTLCKAFDASLEFLKSARERFGMSTLEARLFVQLGQAALKEGLKNTALEVHDAMVTISGCNSSSRWLLRLCERAREQSF